MVQMLRRCSGCGKRKPQSDFYPDRRRRNGYSRVCKVCTYARVRAWQRAHPDRVREQNLRYRLKHPTPKKERRPPTPEELLARQERKRERQREYRWTHRAELRAWKRAYRKKHLQEIRAYSRTYYREHHAHLLALKAKYRQKRREGRSSGQRALDSEQ